MNKYILLIYSIIILLLGESCNSHATDRQLKLIKEIAFSTEGLQRSSYFKIGNKDYICHYDFVTHKKIIAESISGNDESHIINLKPVLKKAHQIFAFDIIDWDNIIIVPAYAKHFYIIDGEGAIKKEIDLSPFLDGDNYYELSFAVSNNLVFNDTSIIFPLEFTMENIPDSLVDDPREYVKARYRSPRLFKIDNFTKDSLVCHFGATDLYPRFTAEDVIAIEFPNYQFVNNQIIFSSSYSDSIYIIDPNTLEIINSIQIKSNYTDLMVNHITGEQVMNTTQNLLTYNSFTDGRIVNFTYDQLSHHYLVFLFHKPDQTEDVYSAVIGNSIAILDSLFNQIEEIKMDHKMYATFCCSTTEGLYLCSDRAHKSDPDYGHKTYYTLFKYE